MRGLFRSGPVALSYRDPDPGRIRHCPDLPTCPKRDLNPHAPYGAQRPQRCVSAVSPHGRDASHNTRPSSIDDRPPCAAKPSYAGSAASVYPSDSHYLSDGLIPSRRGSPACTSLLLTAGRFHLPLPGRTCKAGAFGGALRALAANRTRDLPLTRRTLLPTELQGQAPGRGTVRTRGLLAICQLIYP